MSSSSSQNYRGWFIYRVGSHWYANRAGVRINTNTLAGVKAMIDQRNQDERERNHPEAGYVPQPRVNAQPYPPGFSK